MTRHCGVGGSPLCDPSRFSEVRFGFRGIPTYIKGSSPIVRLAAPQCSSYKFLRYRPTAGLLPPLVPKPSRHLVYLSRSFWGRVRRLIGPDLSVSV
jgi:hypothetical protein